MAKRKQKNLQQQPSAAFVVIFFFDRHQHPSPPAHRHIQMNNPQDFQKNIEKMLERFMKAGKEGGSGGGANIPRPKLPGGGAVSRLLGGAILATGLFYGIYNGIYSGMFGVACRGIA
jgi:hypothetical protein